ncbi:hypothetical protein Q8791_28945 [Nocardiopsis sp. CT-R113]|uniref:DNA-binding phage zinc finger domain-containing protein n=1 Tax=Nocardiopsis codii TaxID=3065942 RepID=A0ABU7KGA3_9ACTN|nr:hypothetical protein [Nocardiopsis sp. CT-R113]MEE2041259.1 hypothetical protein [Nocardiopsis sp. CT-R113]
MKRVLARAAAFDNRRPDPLVLEAWLAAIGDLDPTDALDAVVAHYGDSVEWIKPGHIRARVKRVRAERLRSADLALPPADPDARDYGPQLRKLLGEIADGRTVSRALDSAPTKGTEPPAEYIAARGPGYVRRRAALAVPCPLVGCRMGPGRPCRAPGSRRSLTAGYHPARLDAARAELDAQETPWT